MSSHPSNNNRQNPRCLAGSEYGLEFCTLTTSWFCEPRIVARASLRTPTTTASSARLRECGNTNKTTTEGATRNHVERKRKITCFLLLQETRLAGTEQYMLPCATKAGTQARVPCQHHGLYLRTTTQRTFCKHSIFPQYSRAVRHWYPK